MAAGAALNNKVLLLNPHMKERNYFQKAASPDAGERLYPGPWFKLSKTPGRYQKGLPRIWGKTIRRCLCDILGLTKEDLKDLEKREVIGTTPPFENEDERKAAEPTVLPLDLQSSWDC